MSQAPVIETARLRLRPHRPADLDAALALWSDPDVVRYTIGKPSTDQQTWARMMNYAGMWAMLGFGYWAVEEKMGQSLIGEIGFADFKRGIPLIDGIPEMGWVLHPSHHGKGFGEEGIRAALGWADQNLKREIGCIIDVRNQNSLRLAAKVGFHFQTSVQLNDANVQVFLRPI